MMTIKCFTFGPFETNTYVVSSFPSGEDGRGSVLLIDPACSNEYERRQLAQYIEDRRRGLLTEHRPAAPDRTQTDNELAGLTIIATHGHLDHLWGAKWATEMWGVPVLMHEADIPMAKAMQQQYELFGVRKTAEQFPIVPLTEHRPQAAPADRAQTDNDLAGLTVIHTPGHTPGSICLYCPSLQGGDGEGFLLSGDTLFCMGYGRTDLPGGNMGQLIGSLEELFRLSADVKVYPGHGEFTTIGAERR